MIGEFANEPLTDFTEPQAKQKMLEALAYVRAALGQEYDVVVGGDRLRTPDKIRSLNPARPSEVVGIFQKGTPEMAARAVDVAFDTFRSWQHTPAERRSDYLFRAADVMRRRKLELAAWMVYEVGKSWAEADADVAEAIDFCEFYGRENIRLSGPQPLVRIPTEDNELRYIPLGVTVVVPPWNFPLAILAGMTSAAIVAGNTVVLKPSSDSPTIAYKFVEVMEEAKLPVGVLNFVSGPGGAVGNALVGHGKTRLIAFTGSMEVGLGINELAAKTQPGQIWIKRVIAEMGGKDSIVVDADADFDAAVEGVLLSAYGFQGQKCSACSRVIIDEKLYDRFLDKLTARIKKIAVGPTEDPRYFMGPVINEAALKSMLGYIEKGKAEGGRLLTGGSPIPDADGYFLEPTLIADVDPNATISQEEIFGPVLAAIRARDYAHALDIANNTKFGLTGAVYSNDPEKLDAARKHFHVGNLYLNRKCTGAFVGVHPFGGFNMSGTDSKAGGRDYLLLFTQAKVISAKRI